MYPQSRGSYREHYQPQQWQRPNPQYSKGFNDDFYFLEGTDSEESISPPDTLIDRPYYLPRNHSSSRLSPIDELEYSFPVGPSPVGADSHQATLPMQSPYCMTQMANKAASSQGLNQLPQSTVVPKCRQLPCRTYISTGSCPYGDRCVFLHDLSIVSKPVFIRSKRKSKEDMSTDAFFWPTMPMSAVLNHVDNRNMPLITQPYVIPPPTSYALQNSNNDVAVYSMWEHFLDFCKYDELSVVPVPRKIPLLNPYTTVNSHTGKRRLPIFVKLSQHNESKSIF